LSFKTFLGTGSNLDSAITAGCLSLKTFGILFFYWVLNEVASRSSILLNHMN
jgi:hypothetical protein